MQRQLTALVSLKYILIAILVIVLGAALLFVFREVLAWTNPPPGSPPEGSGSGIMPAGTVAFYGGSTAPSGWLLCDGSGVSTATYANLFSAIGYSYGGSGSTFNLPDLRGRVPVGLGTNVDVDARGDSDGSVLADRRPKHRHTVTISNSPILGRDESAAPQSNRGTAPGIVFAGVSVGPQTNSPVDAPAYLVFNCIIKT